MISEKMVKALNDQINAELYSAYIYSAMQAYFLSVNLDGFANWMSIQTKEEMTHADKFYKFINERNGRIELEAIAKPQKDWKNALEVFEAAYKHEQYVTGRINNLVELAKAEKDYATESFLKWFIDEQVEEEANALKIVEMLKMIKESAGSLIMLDHQLAKREFEKD
ncbi:MAG: ferritin [Planctomycetes bacterium GWF2_42_9]|nr:MAG: ferritin [Planctomycetes bacterium GWF2_42_9]HAL45074.1 ferritin [Phycisphaerales bacterium]